MYEYANTLIHRSADKYTNLEEYATQIAKQSLCFELLKEKSGKLEMTGKEAEDLHLKAEKLADKIDNTGPNFENKAKTDELANSILQEPQVERDFVRYIDEAIVTEFQNKYEARKDITLSETALEYANIIMNKNYKGENIIECMKDAVKQALCFEHFEKRF